MHITKFIKGSGTTALASACLFVSVSTTMAAPPPTVAGTYGTVVIGDLPGMVDRGAELAKKVSPGISGEVIRGQLGMMLGDEGLKSIPAGSGVVVVMPQSGKAFLLIETAEGKAETVANLLKQRLGATTKAVNTKLVAIAMGDAALTNATGAMGTSAAALLEGNDDKFIVATVDTDVLLKDKGAQMDAALKNLEKKVSSRDAGSSASATMVQVFGQLVKSVAKRTDVDTIKIDISGDGILFEKTLYPIGGVTLAKAEGPTGEELQQSIPASPDALFRYENYIDTQSAMPTVTAIIGEALQATNLSVAEKDSITNLLNTTAQGFGDGLAGWTGVDKDGANGVQIVSVIDKEAALRNLDESSKLFSESGALTKLYTSLGMETSMTLQRNTGTIEGQPVHNFSLSVEPADGAPASGLDAKFNKNGQVTVTDDKLIAVFGKTPLANTVTAVKAGTAVGTNKLKSRAGLPAGGSAYADYNPGALASLLKSENPEAASALEGLKDVSIMEAFYTDADSLKLVIKIPGEMITQGVDAAKNLAQKKAAETQDADDAETSDDSAVTTATATTE